MPRTRLQRPKIDWPELAVRVAGALPVARFPAAVRQELGSANSDLGGVDPVALAFSGGADSLALLLALWVHFPQRRASWLVLHFDHCLRGAESAADAKFCAAVARSLGVRFVSGAAGARIRDHREAAAREARFEFIHRVMHENGARLLCLGHHRDDVLETMLMRLSRGAGLTGLAAPRARQVRGDGTVRLRPLLDFSKDELITALRTAGAVWREDRTNATDAYFRNRVRKDLVPVWKRLVPVDVDLAAAVARSRAQLEEDDAALEAWTTRVLEDYGASPTGSCDWSQLPPAIVRRVVHRWWGAQCPGSDMPRAIADPVVAALLCGDDGRFSAGAAGFVVLAGGRLRLESVPNPNSLKSVPGTAAQVLPLPGVWSDGNGGRLIAQLLTGVVRREWTRVARAADIAQRVVVGSVMQQPEPLVVRYWQPGDRYQPFGSAHVSKLQDQFTNRRIPRDLRRLLPVVCRADGEILWVPGIPPAELTRVTSRSRSLVQLTYHPPHPRSHPQDV